MENFYTLFVRDESDGCFYDEFGDYKKCDVKEEADATYWDRKKSDIKIINTHGTAAGILKVLKELN